jgi:hypothetical protein
MLLSAAMFTPPGAAEDNDTLLQERLRAHITFLADDLLRGRQPGTDGYNMAALWPAVSAMANRPK